MCQLVYYLQVVCACARERARARSRILKTGTGRGDVLKSKPKIELTKSTPKYLFVCTNRYGYHGTYFVGFFFFSFVRFNVAPSSLIYAHSYVCLP